MKCVLMAVCVSVGLWSLRASAGEAREDVGVESTLRSLGDSFRAYETEHFVVVSDGGAASARSTGVLLETVHDVFRRMMRRMGLSLAPPKDPLVCVVISDHDRFEAFAMAQDGVDAGWMGGYYATHRNRVVLYDAATSPDMIAAGERLDGLEREAEAARRLAQDARRAGKIKSAEAYATAADRAEASIDRERGALERRATDVGIAKSTHEAAHLLAFNMGLQLRSRSYPFWLSEGLACCFEASGTEAARRGAFGPEVANEVREGEFRSALSESRLVPFEVLVEMASAPGDDAELARVMYAQSYALFRWLYLHEREQLAAYFGDLAREPSGVIGARRHGAMFRDRFGDAEAIGRRVARELGAVAKSVAGSPTDD